MCGGRLSHARRVNTDVDLCRYRGNRRGPWDRRALYKGTKASRPTTTPEERPMGRAEEAGQPPLTTSAHHQRSGDEETTRTEGDQQADCLPAGTPLTQPWRAGLTDSDVDALEGPLVDDDFEEDARRADNARRRLEDRAWLEEVTQNGFAGLVFDVGAPVRGRERCPDRLSTVNMRRVFNYVHHNLRDHGLAWPSAQCGVQNGPG